jgi:hypothetical protein
MRRRFLGKDTQGGGSPSLFATDRGTYVVQGWKVPGHRTSVEVPKKLLRHLEHGTVLDADLRETESCVEVGKMRDEKAGAVAAG